jgi:hypothetical protein
MRPRQITTHGWSVEDDLRADRIAQDRAIVPDEASTGDPMMPEPPWVEQGEEWLQRHADMVQHPSRYLP